MTLALGRRGAQAAARDPAFLVYLLAVGLLPFRWLSPIAGIQQHAEWSDLLIAISALLWLGQRRRIGELGQAYRRWQLPLAAYLGLACISAAVLVPAYGGSRTDLVLMAELAVFAILTADFAAEPVRRRLLVRVIVVSAMVTVALGAIGLILFYAHVRSGLTGVYGEQLTPSNIYTRIRAGLQSPPLLASFCIFASGLAASEDAGLSRRLRITTQICLGLLCAATVSRGLIGFLLAAILRGVAGWPRRRRLFVIATATVAAVGIIGFLTVGRLHVTAGGHAKVTYTVPDPGNRREAFSTSLTTLAHHPLFGVGPGALPGVNAGQPFRAHFTPLNIAATLGVPALVAFLSMLWLLWRDRRRPTDLALWGALAGMALDGLAQDIDHFRHLWVMFGLVGSSRATRRRRPAETAIAADRPGPRREREARTAASS